MADSARALIREARNRINLLHAQAALPGMKWEGRSLRLNEAGWLERLAYALEARLDQQDQLQKEIKRLKTRGGIAVSLIPLAKLPKFHERCALLGLNDWTCDHCGTHWPEQPDLPAGAAGCPECGTYVPEDEG